MFNKCGKRQCCDRMFLVEGSQHSFQKEKEGVIYPSLIELSQRADKKLYHSQAEVISNERMPPAGKR